MTDAGSGYREIERARSNSSPATRSAIKNKSVSCFPVVTFPDEPRGELLGHLICF